MLQQIKLISCGYNKFKLGIILKDKNLIQTIGNTLRRVLISDVMGYMVIGINIDGIYNEIDKINETKEDVIEIINNIKQLEFLCQDRRNIFRAVINTSKRGKVLASDIYLPDGVLIFNRNQYICNLGIGIRFRCELVVACGKGYLTATEVRDMYNPCLYGCLILDVDFNPIKQVSFKIIKHEFNMYSQEEAELIIETNGSMNIVEVIFECCLNLNKNLNSIKESLRTGLN
ncbi:DNA-directed RNA polymerase subunit alpha [Candidatus Hodgkinia cicadicola]|uniref:DNA-directed RNA polymerase subunit alpha n=2 Tax=Candidatus Hodgkinia cicadicola TaxID=573658 RepID=A0ABX4MII8_9HYPH|nr:DNA-directed RNA polymerase subunit alpha [Candidatus Hodgkinia cicadicola]PIM95261.1 DNA-directed RNA polymerase subunit alpha [Candidatus Hodgkinia cicadicola]